MRYAIICSKDDMAGQNLFRAFCAKNASAKAGDDIKVYLRDGVGVHNENIDREIDADCFIFASRHSGKGDVKCLCVHTPGNWADADLGGRERELCIAFPSLQKKIFIELCKVAEGSGYEATMEVTHHGPLIEKPCLFVEIGPSEIEWRDEKAADMLADAVISALRKKRGEYKTAIGIGGTHYCSNLNKVELNTDIALSHICPKHMLEHLDEEMMRKAILRSSEKANLAILDWKGMGKEKQRIIDLLKLVGLRYERSDRIGKSPE